MQPALQDAIGASGCASQVSGPRSHLSVGRGQLMAMNEHTYKRLMQLLTEAKQSGDKSKLNEAFVKFGVRPI